MTLQAISLQALSLGSVAEVLDDEAGEEGDGVEVGFGFGDGYDFGAAAAEALLEAASRKACAASAIEADAVEVAIEAGVVCEDDMAVIGTVAHWGVVLVDAIPVPDGQVGGVGPRAYAAEAQCADEAIEVDDRVRAKCEEADAFVGGSADCQCAACQCHIGVIIHGIICRDEERTAVVDDDL